MAIQGIEKCLQMACLVLAYNWQVGRCCYNWWRELKIYLWYWCCYWFASGIAIGIASGLASKNVGNWRVIGRWVAVLLLQLAESPN